MRPAVFLFVFLCSGHRTSLLSDLASRDNSLRYYQLAIRAEMIPAGGAEWGWIR